VSGKKRETRQKNIGKREEKSYTTPEMMEGKREEKYRYAGNPGRKKQNNHSYTISYNALLFAESDGFC